MLTAFELWRCIHALNAIDAPDKYPKGLQGLKRLMLTPQERDALTAKLQVIADAIPRRCPDCETVLTQDGHSLGSLHTVCSSCKTCPDCEDGE